MKIKELFENHFRDIPLTFKYVNGNNMKTNTKNLLDQYFTKEQIANYVYNKSR